MGLNLFTNITTLIKDGFISKEVNNKPKIGSCVNNMCAKDKIYYSPRKSIKTSVFFLQKK